MVRGGGLLPNRAGLPRFAVTSGGHRSTLSGHEGKDRQCRQRRGRHRQDHSGVDADLRSSDDARRLYETVGNRARKLKLQGEL